MFSGIIETTARVVAIREEQGNRHIELECPFTQELKIDQSIAHNGVCLTVVSIDGPRYTVTAIHETLIKSNLGLLKEGDWVNIERSMRPDALLDGHIVQGHVDCIGKFVRKVDFDEFYELYFELPETECKYVVHKGSVAIDGVSLTVAEIKGNTFKTAIIPHTFNNTTLSELKTGDNVNIETDILGRYVEKFLSPNNNVSKITQNFLQENGFL